MSQRPWNDVDDPGPPRELVGGLRLRLLLGGRLSQTGWGLLAFGLLLLQWRGTLIDFDAVLVFRGDLVQHEARVVESSTSDFSVNEDRVYETTFTWDAEGDTQTDHSWGYEEHAPGAVVTVESPAARPTRARIAGERSGPWPLSAMALFAFFLVPGLLITLFGLTRGRRATQLLVHGSLAQGQLVKKHVGYTTSKGRSVVTYTFAFDDEFGEEQRAVITTHRVELISESEPEPLVYAPDRPERALLLNTLPSRPTPGPHGVEAGSHGTSLFLVLPTITVLGHGAVCLLRVLL